MAHFCVDDGKPCDRIGGRRCGTWYGVYWIRQSASSSMQGERDATHPNEVVPRGIFQPESKHRQERTTHLWTKITKPKARGCSQHKVLPKSLIPSERDQCHPSQSTRPRHSNPSLTTPWHGPARMVAANPLTILIYRPLVLQVVGFVVRCTGVMGCFLIREFPTDLGFRRGTVPLPGHPPPRD